MVQFKVYTLTCSLFEIRFTIFFYRLNFSFDLNRVRHSVTRKKLEKINIIGISFNGYYSIISDM